MEELDSGVHVLTVMATAQHLPDLSLGERFELKTDRARRDFPLFPQEFEVFDAYITNAPSITLMRNFYF